MNTNLNEAPCNTDVILYFTSGRPPVIAGKFQQLDELGEWKTPEYKRVPIADIKGWARIPFYDGRVKED